ncbi:hypothetical protein P775_04090 [Puniceibacterium antarcticum]|uniref:Uncharacterized protein n=1 Tax=Puniceibacterium antarcticum TaxID=1206336 RepID=A0A2G8RK53_9RHOB|nr:hypothetical protein P775_04090 [Puniceibacterium antarcticum]
MVAGSTDKLPGFELVYFMEHHVGKSLSDPPEWAILRGELCDFPGDWGNQTVRAGLHGINQLQ